MPRSYPLKTETQSQLNTLPSSIAGRMAPMKAPQEIIIKLLQSHATNFDSTGASFHKMPAIIDTEVLRPSPAGLGLFTTAGAEVTSHTINPLL